VVCALKVLEEPLMGHLVACGASLSISTANSVLEPSRHANALRR
jgi:hypothetical protein